MNTHPDTPHDPTAIDYQWVLSSAEWHRLLNEIRTGSHDLVVFDLETSSLLPFAKHPPSDPDWINSVTMIAVTLRRGPGDWPTYVVPIHHPDSPFIGKPRHDRMTEQFARALAEGGKPIVNHNLKFDLLWLWAHGGRGVDLSHLLHWDTRTADHALDENTSSRLKDIVPRLHPDVESWADVELSGGAHLVDLFALGHYAARDTYWTLWLYEEQCASLGADVEVLEERWVDPFGEFEPDEIRLALHFHLVAMPMERGLFVNERTGMRIDMDRLNALRDEREEIESQTWERLIGRYPEVVKAQQEQGNKISLAPTSKFWKAMAEHACQQDDLRVISMTGTGAPQWNKAVLIKLQRMGYDMAPDLLAWRSADKQLTFLNAWDGFVNGGEIHPSLRSTSTRTGRTSSANPNVQQVTKVIKPAWAARPGRRFAEIDYSQIEMRVAAHVAPSPPMLQAYRDGIDLHSKMAADTMGIPIMDVTGDQRQRGKAGNFGFLFGMTAEGFVTYAAEVYDVSFTLDESKEFRSSYFTLWEGLKEWHVRVEEEAMRTGKILSPLGRTRHVPDALTGDRYQVHRAVRQAINSPIQSMASDMLQMANAMVTNQIPSVTPRDDVWALGSVHDSLLLEVAEDTWKEAIQWVMDLMVTEVPRYLSTQLGVNLTVPLAVEAEIGPAWGEYEDVLEAEAPAWVERLSEAA